MRRPGAVRFPSCRGVTLVEVMVAVGVFGLVSMVVFGFTRWMNSAQALTGWKQSSLDAIRLNEVFWQKYFSAATGKIKSLTVDAKGVVVGTPDIATEPVKIRFGGTGNLMMGYVDGPGEWPVWRFNAIQQKTDGSGGYQDRVVTGYLTGSRPDVRLHARIQVGGKTVLHQELLANVVGLEGSVRAYPEESAQVLTIEFLLQNPQRPDLRMREKSQFRISTDIEPL